MKEKPMPPGDYECCESGCERCVWDVYREDMNEWQQAQTAESTSEKEESAG